MQLTPRAYQLSIFNSIQQYGNTLVVLPTGLGKTLIALMLIREKIKQGRCLLLTPTKPLAKQHFESVKEILELDDAQVSLVTGEMAPAKRKTEYEKDIIISTPQTIRNDIMNDRFGSNYKLVIFDECLDGDSKIRLYDGSEIPIKKIVHEDKPIVVQSYNIEKNIIEAKEVTAFHKIPCKKKFIKLRSEDNIIKCTEDHLILCKEKNKLIWKKASDIKSGSLVAISQSSPINSITYENNLTEDIIGAHNIKSTYSNNWNRSKQHYFRTLQRIKKARIFPLNYKNPNLLILARLFGYALGDGWLTNKNKQPSCLGFCGLSSDLKIISKDIKNLDGKNSRIQQRITQSKISKSIGVINVKGLSESYRCSSSHIVRTMYALGYPNGDKVTNNYKIPSWLMKSPIFIIREFLSGLMSAEGHVPTPSKKGRTIFVCRLSFYKDKKIKESGICYATDLIKLFKKVGVNATYSIRKGNLRKDGTETLRFDITIGNSISNQIAFLRNILFIYSNKKMLKAKTILVYLLMKRKELENRRNDCILSNKLHKRGLSASDISKITGIKDHTIETWIYLGRKPGQTSIFIPPYNEWKNSIPIMDTTPFVWTKIKKTSELKSPEYVYDLTVKDNSNYFANNLLVHNCHRAIGDYAYTFIAKNLHKDSLFVALTASPGGRSDRIKEVLENLFIENIEIRTSSDPDVSPYVQKSSVTWIPIELSPTLLLIKKELDLLTSKYAKRLGEMGFPPPLKHKGKFLQMRNRILAIPSNIKYTVMVQYSVLLHVLHMSELLETQGVQPLEKYIAKIQEKETKSARLLLHEPGLSKIREYASTGALHPKLGRLVEILKGMKGKKVIVFAQYRDQIKQIEDLLNAEGIPAKQFVGKKDGITRKIQEATIAEFREGKFEVLVASSIGEEGLDIPKVDSVIFYEPIPSEIRSIQRRGRAARLRKGEIFVLMTKATRDEAYHYSSKRKEERMKSILSKMQKSMKKGKPPKEMQKPADPIRAAPPAARTQNPKPKAQSGQTKMSDFL